MIDPIVSSLLAAGVVKAGEVTYDRFAELLRQHRSAGILADVEEKFHEEFEVALKEIAKGSHPNLYAVAADWDEIRSDLDDIDFVVNDRGEAVEELAAFVEARAEPDLDGTDPDALREAIAIAYEAALDEFFRNVAGTELGRELQQMITVELATMQTETLDGIKQLRREVAPPRRYELYDPDEELDDAVERIVRGEAYVDGTHVEYVDRPEVDHENVTGRILVTGPAGSGKTRVLGELLSRIDTDRIDHVLVAGDNLQAAMDRNAIARESFDRDVVLVWDDVHRITEDRENKVFELIVTELEDNVGAENVHVLAAARSGNLDALPGTVNPPSDLWEPFEVLRLEQLDRKPLEDIADELADAFGVDVEPEVRDELIKRAAAESEPVYIKTVFETCGGELTLEGVAELPDEVREIWEKQYKYLAENEETAHQVLEACKLLYDVGFPLYAPFVLGVYQHVLNCKKRPFRAAVESLVDRQWLTLAGEDVLDDDAWYLLHDTQLEPIGQRVEDYDEEFSEFLFERLEDCLPEVIEYSENIFHAQFATALQRRDEPESDLAEEHYEHVLGDDDSVDEVVHHHYATLLAETGRPEEAESHYKRALELTAPADADAPLASEYAEAHYNYATLLAERGRPAEAEVYYERALELTAPADADDPLASEYAEAHNNYATLLKKTGRPAEDEDHHDRALELTAPADADDPLASEYVEAHYNYATLLAERGRPEMAEVHHNYATLLAETGRPAEAESHYERALELTAPTDADDLLASENPEVHNSYANLLAERGRPEEAESHYERALELTAPADADDPLASEYAESHANYGFLLTDLEQFSDARPHLETSVELWLERGKIGNALKDSIVLVRACEGAGDGEAALEHCERALEWAESGHGTDWQRRLLREQYAGLSARDPDERVPELYQLSLARVRDGDPEIAQDMFEQAWDLRMDLDSESSVEWQGLASGVWLVALDPHAEAKPAPMEEVREAVEPDQLSATAASLYRTTLTDEVGRTPSELRQSIGTDDWLAALEIDAYERLLALASEE